MTTTPAEQPTSKTTTNKDGLTVVHKRRHRYLPTRAPSKTHAYVSVSSDGKDKRGVPYSFHGDVYMEPGIPTGFAAVRSDKKWGINELYVGRAYKDKDGKYRARAAALIGENIPGEFNSIEEAQEALMEWQDEQSRKIAEMNFVFNNARRQVRDVQPDGTIFLRQKDPRNKDDRASWPILARGKTDEEVKADFRKRNPEKAFKPQVRAVVKHIDEVRHNIRTGRYMTELPDGTMLRDDSGEILEFTNKNDAMKAGMIKFDQIRAAENIKQKEKINIGSSKDLGQEIDTKNAVETIDGLSVVKDTASHNLGNNFKVASHGRVIGSINRNKANKTITAYDVHGVKIHEFDESLEHAWEKAIRAVEIGRLINALDSMGGKHNEQIGFAVYYGFSAGVIQEALDSGKIADSFIPPTRPNGLAALFYDFGYRQAKSGNVQTDGNSITTPQKKVLNRLSRKQTGSKLVNQGELTPAQTRLFKSEFLGMLGHHLSPSKEYLERNFKANELDFWTGETANVDPTAESSKQKEDRKAKQIEK